MTTCRTRSRLLQALLEGNVPCLINICLSHCFEFWSSWGLDCNGPLLSPYISYILHFYILLDLTFYNLHLHWIFTYSSVLSCITLVVGVQEYIFLDPLSRGRHSRLRNWDENVCLRKCIVTVTSYFRLTENLLNLLNGSGDIFGWSEILKFYLHLVLESHDAKIQCSWKYLALKLT